MIFDEQVSVGGTRENGITFRGSALARVVDNGVPGGFDGSPSSNRRDVMVFIRKSAWQLASRDLPKTGDIITRTDRTTFAVRRVNDIGSDILTLEASQC